MTSSKKPSSKPSNATSDDKTLYMLWRERRSVHAFGKLMQAFEPMMSCTLAKLDMAGVQKGAAQAEVVKRFSEAVRSYDPEKSITLSAWVYWHMKKALRHVTEPKPLSKMTDRELYEMAIGLLKKNADSIKDIERKVAKLARSIDAHLSPVR